MKRILLGLFVAFALPAAAQQPQQNPILERQVAVLRELADEGVIEARYQLALLAQRHPGSPIFDRVDTRPYLTLAAASGHKQAIRSLAFRLLRSDAQADRQEAATLIAVAALLGDATAAGELGVLPKMTPVTASQMVTGFRDALARVAGGMVIDCDSAAIQCPNGVAPVAGVDAGALVAARNLRDSGRFPDLAAIRRYFRPQAQEYEPFTEAEYVRFQREQRARNEPVRERRAQRREAEESRDRAAGERRAYLDRQRRRERAAQRYLGRTLDADMTRYRDAITEALAAINRHRAPERAYPLERVLERLREATP